MRSTMVAGWVLPYKVAAYGDGRQAVAAPDQARFKTVLEAADLAERHALAAARRYGKVGQRRQVCAFLAVAAQHDIDGFLAFAEAGDVYSRSATC
jgi:hypothetical protein